MDTIAITYLVSPAGQLAMILCLCEVIKAALFVDNAWRDRLMPLVALLVGLMVGTVAGIITRGPLDQAGLIGLALGATAVGLYPRVLSPVVGAVQAVLVPKKPPAPVVSDV